MSASVAPTKNAAGRSSGCRGSVGWGWFCGPPSLSNVATFFNLSLSQRSAPPVPTTVRSIRYWPHWGASSSGSRKPEPVKHRSNSSCCLATGTSPVTITYGAIRPRVVSPITGANSGGGGANSRRRGPRGRPGRAVSGCGGATGGTSAAFGASTAGSTAMPATARRSSIGNTFGFVRFASSWKSGRSSRAISGATAIFTCCGRQGSIARVSLPALWFEAGGFVAASMCLFALAIRPVSDAGVCSGFTDLNRRELTPPHTRPSAASATTPTTSFSQWLSRNARIASLSNFMLGRFIRHPHCQEESRRRHRSLSGRGVEQGPRCPATRP